MSTSIVDVGGVNYLVRETAGMTGGVDTSQKTHTLRYDIWREDNDEPSIIACYEAMEAVAPTTFDGLNQTSITYSEDDDTGHYLFSVTYGSQSVTSAFRWSFDTTGGTIRLTTSRATTAFTRTGRTAPDFKNAIGVKQTGKDAEPEGVDITIPGLKLTATYRWPKDTFDLAKAKAVSQFTGYVNSDTFETFAAGEILFLGATGEIVPGIPTEVQYHFLASQNVTGLTIGDISSIAKKGHEYLWVAFEAEEDTSAKKLVQRPLAVYVEQVYGTADLNDLWS